MNIALFWASVALAPAVLAQSTTTSIASSTSTSAAPSCTASLITTLCNYTEPDADFAVAIDSTASCWDYCNAKGGCNFVIFSAGNPTTGSGTCWLYPGEQFDASAGSSDCSSPSLSVYSQPMCSASGATTTSGTCTATAVPSAVASVCNYPVPDDCFDDCYASNSASDCLSICAKAASCSFVVFNAHNNTCWAYPNGTYDTSFKGTCDQQQFIYDNPCPKSSALSSSVSSSGTASPTSTGTAGATSGTSAGSTTSSGNLAPTGLSFSDTLVVGVAALMWQAM